MSRWDLLLWTAVLALVVLGMVLFLRAQTQLSAPVNINVPAGRSPTWTMDVTPATAQFPCPTVAQRPPVPPARWRLCAQGTGLAIDTGGGYKTIVTQ